MPPQCQGPGAERWASPGQALGYTYAVLMLAGLQLGVICDNQHFNRVVRGGESPQPLPSPPARPSRVSTWSPLANEQSAAKPGEQGEGVRRAQGSGCAAP